MKYKEDTSKIYYERINRVLTYINNHLDEKLDLEKIAEISLFSSFHFHRIMRAYLNESIGSYIIRIRIETAANLILNTSLPVSEIAFKVGYDSPSSFNKAFQKRFGTSPIDFKNQRKNDIVINYIETTQTQKIMEIKATIKTIKEKKVIYTQTIGDYNSGGISVAWEKVCDFAKKKRLFGWKTEFIGISHDDPEITDAEKLRYDACVCISKNVDPEGEIGVKEIKGGKYAVFMHKGPYENFQQTYNAIYKQWLPESGHTLRNLPCFELYLNSPDKTKPEKLKTEIYIPIE